MRTMRMLAAAVLTLAAISTTALGAPRAQRRFLLRRQCRLKPPPMPPRPQPKGEPAAAALTATDLDAWLDGYLPYALKTGDIAGAVVAVVHGGQIVTDRGYGYFGRRQAHARRPETDLCSARDRCRSCLLGPPSCSWSSRARSTSMRT